MSRLSIFISAMAWTVVSGVIIVGGLSLGYYGWLPFISAVVIGFVIGIPIAIWIARRIKRDDDSWDEVRDKPMPPRQKQGRKR